MKIFGMTFGVDAQEDGNKVILTGLRVVDLKRYIKKKYGASTFLDKMCYRIWSGSLLFHKFFLPEIVYLLKNAMDENYISKYRTKKLLDCIFENTWMKDTIVEIDSIIDLPKALKNIKPEMKLKDYQQEFIEDKYYQFKTKYHLNGYLLALDPGLGKTFTSLALGESLSKKHFVVISPLPAIKTAWLPEIEKVFIKPKNTWNPSLDPSAITKNTDIVVMNYDSIDKVVPYIIKMFNPIDTIVIIDESHSFKDIKSQRTQSLLQFLKAFNCPDILPMSGTPIKALGIEVLPILAMLDGWYSGYIEDKLKSMTRHTKIINELFRNRLGYLMYRKTKQEALTGLPEKHEIDLKIKVVGGERYTLENVKTMVVAYTAERRDYYKKTYKQFQETYENCLKLFEKTLSTNLEWNEYKTYLKQIALIQKHGHGWDMIEPIKASNIYEKNVIIPALPPGMRASFRSAKSVIKYVELKILGEVLGGLLNQLRTEMCAEMMGKEVIDIILAADKKTILFSSYREALRIAEEVCAKYGLKTITITGENSSDAKKYLDEFKNNPEINPLLASIKTMSTAHTIIVANTVIFLDRTFRSVEYQQASDRVYRIGQDTPVYIYTMILDTGDEPNLSTRMQDIVAWSKSQFGEIVGDITDEETGLNNAKTVVSNVIDASDTNNFTDLLKLANNILHKLTSK